MVGTGIFEHHLKICLYKRDSHYHYHSQDVVIFFLWLLNAITTVDRP